MRTGLRMAIPTALLLAALTACSGGGSTAPAAASNQAAAQQQAPAQGGKAAEEPLTGDVKQQAEAAALAQFPGAVVKSEHDAEKPGMYAVEIKQADGKNVEVYLDQGFTVSGTKDEGQENGADSDG